MSTKATYGAWLRKERTRMGLSQAQLGKKVGVSNKTISNYESGHVSPPAKTKAKLDELFIKVEEPKPQALVPAPANNTKDLSYYLQTVEQLGGALADVIAVGKAVGFDERATTALLAHFARKK